MSSEFCRLSDIASIQGGYAFKSKDFGDEGIAVIKIANIQPSGIVLEGADRIHPEKLVGLDRFRLKDGDILMAMTGATVGKVARFKEFETAYLNQRVARISSLKGHLYDDFIYAVISQPGFDSFVESASAGSAQANISATGIGSILIPSFSDDEKIKIGNLARALDDRIALLRETNATLESIAQAIFKSWFIDFDPVKAKQQGEEPQGMDAATAALFPDAFQDSELGAIPAEWEVLPLGELVCSVGGGTPSTKEISYWEPAEFAWTTPKDLSAQESPVLLKTERMISEKGVEKISSGLLPKGTLLLSSRAPIGYLAITDIPLCINQGYIAILPDSVLSPLYMLFWCKNHMELIKNRSNGSTFMEINKKSFREISAMKPPEVLLKCFTDLIAPVFDRIVENKHKTQTLASIRGTLLPRLISGKLRLPEAEAMVEEAGL